MIYYSILFKIYRVCAISLGIPPTTFTWEYYDKNKKYVCMKDITPLEFYTKHVKPICNLEDKVGIFIYICRSLLVKDKVRDSL